MAVSHKENSLSVITMKLSKKIYYLVGVIVLALGCWLTTIFYFGSVSIGLTLGLVPVWLVVFAILSWRFTMALTAGARKVNVKVWIFAGLLILAGWFLPASTFIRLFPFQDGEPFGSPLALTLIVTISLSLVIAAQLINSGLHLFIRWQNANTVYYRKTKEVHENADKVAIALLILSFILVIRALYKFYWFMIWDSTTDGLGYLWLPIPFLAILSSTIMLLITWPDGIKVNALFYLLLIPILIVISSHTQQADFHHLTESRAEKVSQKLDAYYAHEGHYPENLQTLFPRYFISIPRPVIIYEQNWCYDAGTDYYRIGYLSRDHWSSPNLFGQTFRVWGEVPGLPAICEQEAEALQKRYPDYPYEYWVEGE